MRAAKDQIYDQSEMLRQITPGTMHAPIDFDKLVGEEG